MGNPHGQNRCSKPTGGAGTSAWTKKPSASASLQEADSRTACDVPRTGPPRPFLGLSRPKCERLRRRRRPLRVGTWTRDPHHFFGHTAVTAITVEPVLVWGSQAPRPHSSHTGLSFCTRRIFLLGGMMRILVMYTYLAHTIEWVHRMGA